MDDPETQFVDPRSLHLPASRTEADPVKLQRQIARFGRSAVGMPVIWVRQGTDGELLISDGITRATRIAKLSPGELVPVEVIQQMRIPVGHLPTIGERLP